MARDVVALVSADDVVATIRVHADRAHDLLRRGGTPADQTLPLLFRHAAGLIDAVGSRPEAVGDLAGWWFGRCLDGLTADPFTTDPRDLSPGMQSVLAGTETELALRVAIARLPRPERVAVMLRDAYDLPLQAVAVALGRGTAAAAELVAAGRIGLMAGYAGRSVPDRAGHVGRQAMNLLALSAVADGSADPSVTLTTRRHLSACPVCEEYAEQLGRARRLALGLPVLAMPDGDREALIDAVRERAMTRLPSHEEVLAAAAADAAGHGVPVILTIGALLVAAVAGAGIGVLSRHGEQASAAPVFDRPAPPLPTTATTTPASPVRSPNPQRSTRTLPPVIVRTGIPSSAGGPSSSTSASGATTTSPPTMSPSLSISPAQGPSGTVISVVGSDFQPDATVSLSYNGEIQQTLTSDGNGDFTGTVTADAALPGTYPVTADDGVNSRSREFTQTP